jgi:hypothetical protein
MESETSTRSLRVQVIETQLLVAAAGVRHRVRLACLDEESRLHAETLALE